MDGWRFYVLFKSVSVISGQWEGDNEKPYSMEPCVWLNTSPPPGGIKTVLIKLKFWGSLASGGLALESPDVGMVMLFI